MHHSTPQIFATDYTVDFKEEAESYKAMYLKLEEELRIQKEINTSLAAENARLRGPQKESPLSQLDRPMPWAENVYYDGSPPPKDWVSRDKQLWGNLIVSG